MKFLSGAYTKLTRSGEEFHELRKGSLIGGDSVCLDQIVLEAQVHNYADHEGKNGNWLYK